LSAEDSSSDTLRPRLEAAGACLDRIHVLRAAHIEGQRTTFDLAADLRPLGEHIDAIGDVALVLIDPITSYMGRIDSHRTTDVRRVLEPLADFAEKHNVAVVGISHPPKATQTKAIHAVTGSGAFVAAPRLVFIAMEELESQRSLLLAVKNNLGALAPGLAYRRVQTIVSKGIVASHIVWDTAPVTITANEALAVANNPPPAMGEAIDFLRQELANGPQPQKDLKKSAEAAAISWSTVKRAKKALNVKTSKVGLTEGWQWRLPEEDQAIPPKEPN
jgi:AAA domain